MAYMFFQMKFGERLRAARELAGLTQEELARRVRALIASAADDSQLGDDEGISQPAISQLEKSPTATGSKYTAHFAYVCGVGPMWLAQELGDKTVSYSTDHRVTHVMRAMDALDEAFKDKLVKETDSLIDLQDRLKPNTATGQ